MKFPLYVFITILLAGCTPNETPVSKLWFYTYSTGGTQGTDSLLTTASFLELRPNGSYTQDFGRFDYGNWTLKGTDLYLTNQHHTTYIFRLTELRPLRMQLLLGKDRTGHFNQHPLPSGRSSKDPFSISNNQWRVPATHKESIDGIRQRLFNHYQFWEAYFNWAADNNIGAINVRSIPTPMKIYGNGFGLKRYDSLSVRWKACFFDETDCHTADTLIKGVFRRNKINWPDVDDQNQLFISGIQQVRQFLK